MKLGYALFYVDDVEETMNFYASAFGLKKGFLHEGNQYGEMATGETKLGFVHHETAGAHGFKYEKMSKTALPTGFEIGLITVDVAGAFKHAVGAGAESVALPVTKPWGQVVAYVKDLNGFLIELCSPMG